MPYITRYPPGNLRPMGIEKLGTITLTGLRATGYHGVFDSERSNGQEFIVDLEVELEMPNCDDISETVDYGTLASKVTTIVQGEPMNLIETLASTIATSVLEDQRIQSTRVSVHKPHAPIAVPFDDVTVTISRRNHVRDIFA